MKKNVMLFVIFLALATWQCSKTDQGNNNLSLKESVNQSVAKINTAFEKISLSRGYQLFSISEASAKSDYGFHDSINLALIAGNYEFSPDTLFRHNDYFPHRLFTKTGTSDKFIVSLPQSLVYHPKHLHFYEFSETVPNNDFTITASDYHFYYNSGMHRTINW